MSAPTEPETSQKKEKRKKKVMSKVETDSKDDESGSEKQVF